MSTSSLSSDGAVATGVTKIPIEFLCVIIKMKLLIVSLLIYITTIN